MLFQLEYLSLIILCYNNVIYIYQDSCESSIILFCKQGIVNLWLHITKTHKSTREFSKSLSRCFLEAIERLKKPTNLTTTSLVLSNLTSQRSNDATYSGVVLWQMHIHLFIEIIPCKNALETSIWYVNQSFMIGTTSKALTIVIFATRVNSLCSQLPLFVYSLIQPA